MIELSPEAGSSRGWRPIETEEAQAILSGVGMALLVVDGDGHVRSANDLATSRFDLDSREPLPSLTTISSPALQNLATEVRRTRTSRCLSLRVGPQLCTVRAMPHGDSEVALAILEVPEPAEVDEKLVTFLGLLAHELRNPLTPMRTVIEILNDAEAGRKLDWCRGMMQRQIDRLTNVIDNLLDVARLARGKLTLRREILDLGSIVRRAAAQVEPLAASRRQQVTLEIPDRELPVDGDPLRLEQIFVQLLRNAIKFSRTGGLVELVVDHPDSQSVVARVRDRGCGIAPRALDRLFERRLGVADEESHDGLGLGLQLVQHLVSLHGGQISAVSGGPGHGSEFIVSLPAARPTDTMAVEPAATHLPLLRVLIVDDNEDAVTSTAALLRRHGFEVGEELLQPARRAAGGLIVRRVAHSHLCVVRPLSRGLPPSSRRGTPCPRSRRGTAARFPGPTARERPA